MIQTLSNVEVENFLQNQMFGNLGCCKDGIPSIYPMAYVYRDNVIYGQTTLGEKINIVRQNPEVCFQVSETDEKGWKSVMCWGRFEELDFNVLEPGVATTVVELLTRRIGSIQGSIGVEIPYETDGSLKPGTSSDGASTLFHIVLHKKVGRCCRKS